MTRKILLLILAAPLFVAAAFAYEPHRVHHDMTAAAFRAADADTKILKMLNLKPAMVLDGRTAEEWCAKGGVDEDAGFPPFPRSLAHFYDPINAIPLSIGFCPKFPFGVRADIWGIDHSLNTYDIDQAKSDYFAALTLPTAAARDQRMGRLFYTLGHVMHLVEDMAQPEHTRNDQHLFPASLYEKFTFKLFDDPASINHPTFNPATVLTGYSRVQLPDYESYFHTAAREGMADFANNNFVTQDTNFHDTVRNCPPFNYADPSLAGVTSSTVTKTDFVKVGGPIFYTTQLKTFDVTTYRHNIPDRFTGQNEIDRILTYASFLDYETDRFLDGYRFYSLNDDAYYDHAQLLIPRAVGYAEGILSHFFRGRVSAKWTANGSELDWILDLKNESAEGIQNPTLRLYARVANGANDVLVPVYQQPMAPLPAGGTISIPITVNLTLQSGQSFLGFERRIVITGRLGAEDGAVIGLVQPPSEGSLLAIRSMTPPQPNELVRVEVAGDGTLTKIRDLGVSAPFSFLPGGSDFPAPKWSNNSHLVAKHHRSGGVSRIYIHDLITGLTNEYPALLGPQKINGDGMVAWSADDTRVAMFASMCVDPQCKGIFKLKFGIAILDIRTSSYDFMEFTQINQAMASSVIFVNHKEWSRDGHYLVVQLPSTGPEFARFDLFSRQLEFGGLPRLNSGIYPFIISPDGSKIYESRVDPIQQRAHGLWEFSWFGGSWQLLTGDRPDALSFTSQLALSQDGTRIAYARNLTTCGPAATHQLWTYSLLTGEDKPTSAGCTGLSSPGFYREIRWERDH